jgi:molybdopterin-guanine dinucleotide biosynthesis protein A
MSFSAALIVGGRSSRMGTDKAFLDWKGRPLWRHQMETLRATGADEIFVCARKGQLFPDEKVLVDPAPGLGPLAGLARALEGSKGPLVLVLAVDLPVMTEGFLRGRLLAAADDTGAVPWVDGFYEPLAAVYPKRLSEEVQRRLLGVDRSLQSLCGWAEAAGIVQRIAVTDAERALFRNLNSPEDLAG